MDTFLVRAHMCLGSGWRHPLDLYDRMLVLPEVLTSVPCLLDILASIERHVEAVERHDGFRHNPLKSYTRLYERLIRHATVIKAQIQYLVGTRPDVYARMYETGRIRSEDEADALMRTLSDYLDGDRRDVSMILSLLKGLMSGDTRDEELPTKRLGLSHRHLSPPPLSPPHVSPI